MEPVSLQLELALSSTTTYKTCTVSFSVSSNPVAVQNQTQAQRLGSLPVQQLKDTECWKFGKARVFPSAFSPVHSGTIFWGVDFPHCNKRLREQAHTGDGQFHSSIHRGKMFFNPEGHDKNAHKPSALTPVGYLDGPGTLTSDHLVMSLLAAAPWLHRRKVANVRSYFKLAEVWSLAVLLKLLLRRAAGSCKNKKIHGLAVEKGNMLCVASSSWAQSTWIILNHLALLGQE